MLITGPASTSVHGNAQSHRLMQNSPPGATRASLLASTDQSVGDPDQGVCNLSCVTYQSAPGPDLRENLGDPCQLATREALSEAAGEFIKRSLYRPTRWALRETQLHGRGETGLLVRSD